MTKKYQNSFQSDIKNLIKDMEKPDYITNFYAKIGISSLIVLKGIFRTENSYLGNYLIQVLLKKRHLFKDKTVLDLGCGCGILGIICSMQGAKSVHFSDINPRAVKNSQLNSLFLEIKNASFSMGNLFENIPQKKFDVIIFNGPTISGKPSSFMDAAFIREDKIIFDFLKESHSYLNKDGFILIPSSTRYNKNSLLGIIKKSENRFRILDKSPEANKDYLFTIRIFKKIN